MLAAALFATPSHAATPQPSSAPVSSMAGVTGEVRPLQDYLSRGYTAAQATVMRRLDTLAAGGVPLSALQGQVPNPPNPCLLVVSGSGFSPPPDAGIGDVLAAGDLNGDGRPDVVETRVVWRDKTTNTWVVNARDARTGHVLWTKRRVLDKDHYGFGLPLKVGRLNRPGLLLLVLGAHFEGTLTFRGTVDDDLVAVDGTGRQVWHHSDAGKATFGVTRATYKNAPLGIHLTRLRKGADDLLVTTYNTEGPGVTGRLTRLAGSDGHADRPYPPISGASVLAGPVDDLTSTVLGPDDTLPYLGVVPDQDGDRFADVYTGRVGDTHVLSTYGGVRGNLLWSNSLLPLYDAIDIRDAGLLTAQESRRHDLAVSSAVPSGGLSVSVPPVGEVGANAAASVMLVGGGTGTLQWLRFGRQSYPLQRFGSPLVPALGVASWREIRGLSSHEIRVRLDVYDVLGTPLSSKEYSYTTGGNGCDTVFTDVYTDMTDLDADGSLEARIRFLVFGSPADTVRWAQIAVRGRDGATLDRSTAFPVHGSLDGHGDDRASMKLHGSAVSIQAFHGEGLRPMWTVDVPALHVPAVAAVFAVPATSDRCEDVGLHEFAYRVTPAGAWRLAADSVALIASNGKPWWTVVYDEGDLTGQLIKGTGGRPLCASGPQR